MMSIAEWVAERFSQGIIPPFSFIYDDQSSSELLQGWQYKQEGYTFTYTDPQTKLQICCACEIFPGFPALEWALTLKNCGESDTPIIEDIQAIDVVQSFGTEEEFTLHHAMGSSASRMDFAPVDIEMTENEETKFAPVGGRSSNTTALPFFNIEGKGEGLFLGIGWSGQWAASLTNAGNGKLKMRAGMELTYLKLHPGEEIRTPRILLLFWEGDERMAANNLLRRFILTHHTLHADGKPVTTPLACNGGPQMFNESNNATEQNQIALAQRYRQFGLDTECWWIDAGWYEGGWPNGVGSWFVRKDGFPNSLRAVSDAVKELGMGFLLWFEPERVHQGTWLDRDHPEWVIKLPDSPNGLLNLGDPKAIRWLIDHVSGMIESEGIGIYRQDFNMDPLPYWRATDESDRQGITEIRYIENLYTFWDELLDRHPGLIIDNCASGGRRIDLETISRSIPLWRTDYQYFEPNGYQCHTYGLSFYLPCSGTGNGYPDPYSFRSSMNSGFVLGWNLYLPDFPVEQAQHLIAEYKRLRPLFYGDYFPLTEHKITDDVWMAYQFYRQDMKQGMILAFRRPESPCSVMCLKPGGLQANAQYEVVFEDTGDKKILNGDEFGAGIDVEIIDAPGSLLITYREYA